MWFRKHPFGRSGIGKVFLDVTVGRGCLRLFVTLFIRVRQQSVQPELTERGEVDEVDNSIPNPETTLLQNRDREMSVALERLPVEFREAIVLREMEGLSYKEIADIVGAPIGTVMSRLARGRRRLQIYLTSTAVRNL